MRLPPLLFFFILLLILSFTFPVSFSTQSQFFTQHNYSSSASQLPLNPHLPYTLWSEAELAGAKPFKEAPEPAMQGDENHVKVIRPGSILVATENLVTNCTYPFNRSRVLIVKANQSTGFEGLIINRLIIWDVLAVLDDSLDPLKDAPISYGGLRFTNGYILVSLTRQSVGNEQHPEVLPGVYFLDQLATLKLRQNLKSSVSDYWFFFGYSKWGWNQLLDEVNDGKWDVINGAEQQFDWPTRRWDSGSLFGKARPPYTLRGKQQFG